MAAKKIVFVVNVDWFFVSHRLPLALEAIHRGWIVYLVSKDTGKFAALEEMGIRCIDLEFERSGKNPFKELNLIRKLKKIYQTIQPQIVHHITLKPCIYGTIALKHFKGVKVINAVSGLGYSFTDNRKSLSKVILLGLLKWAFKSRSSGFIFQNPDDRDFYGSMNFLTSDNYALIKGSGVDETLFPYIEPQQKRLVTITLLARMLKDKGVVEFIQAAKLLEKDYKDKLEFVLVGGIDIYNPAHLSEAELQNFCDGSYIKWLGHTQNVIDIYSNSDVVCLPSYREGLPKSLVEAMAVGRPIITTDAIGCRECVQDGINGYLVPVKDSSILAGKIAVLASNPELRISMGLASRKKMLNEMSLKQVISQTFNFYAK